jgi:hypothetical protein
LQLKRVPAYNPPAPPKDSDDLSKSPYQEKDLIGKLVELKSFLSGIFIAVGNMPPKSLRNTVAIVREGTGQGVMKSLGISTECGKTV